MINRLNFRTLDLNLLRVFDEVMAERNLTRAAHNLALSQPAVSNALRRLRELLGDDLVRRSGYGVEPTPLALQIWPAVREALQRLQRFGLVEVAVGRYTRVSEPSESLRQETGESTAYFMGNALRIALRRCTDDELAVLVDAADAVVAAARREDGLSLFEASTTMFQQVTRGTGNSVFIGFIREASLAIQRNLHGWQPFISCPIARADGYIAFRESIATRDGDAAERTLRYLHGLA